MLSKLYQKNIIKSSLNLKKIKTRNYKEDTKKTSTKSGFDNVAQLFLDLLKNQNVWIHKIDTKELESIKEISQNFNISFYDACYLYLSINLGYPLITMDKPFYKRIINDYPDTILVG